MVAGRSRPPPTYLVDGGRDGGEGEQGLELLAGEVADADGLGQAQAVALLHGLPHAPRVERLEVLLHEGGRVPAGLHGNGPVDQVQVHVLHLEVAATSGNGVGYQEQISLSCASEAVSVNNTLLVDCCIAQATKKSSYCNEQRCTLLRSANSYGTVERNYRAHITCSFSGPINKIILRNSDQPVESASTTEGGGGAAPYLSVLLRAGRTLSGCASAHQTLEVTNTSSREATTPSRTASRTASPMGASVA
jgi:hypothetical protein